MDKVFEVIDSLDVLRKKFPKAWEYIMTKQPSSVKIEAGIVRVNGWRNKELNYDFFDIHFINMHFV